jgi:hypothetical protein
MQEFNVLTLVALMLLPLHKVWGWPVGWSNVSQTFLLADSFWFLQITTDRHILSHVNIGSQDDRYPKSKIYLRTEFRELRIHTNSIRNNVLHYLTLIKLTVARCVGTGSFLTRYSNDHTQKKKHTTSYRCSAIISNKTLFFSWKKKK